LLARTPAFDKPDRIIQQASWIGNETQLQEGNPMTETDIIAPMPPAKELPAIERITMQDLFDALRKGLDDFRVMPTHVVFLCLIYPIIGLLLGRMAFGYNVIPLLYPLAAGFALVGPIAALGLDTSWRHAFDVFRSPSLPSIALLGGLLLVTFIVWVAIAHHLFVRTFGYSEPTSIAAFISQILTTSEGHYLIIVGNLVGFILAVFVLEIGVISFPLLLDRNVGAAVAMATSVRAVTYNPVVMAAWGVIVAVGLAVGFLFALVGLAVIVPILGHATWHLYRKVVAPDLSPRPEYRPRPRTIRYGAQFPSSLFLPSVRESEDGDTTGRQ
jgi:uncharacterized membrane protein